MKILITTLVILAPSLQDKLARGDAVDLREEYAEALADPSGKTTKKLVTLGEKLARKKSPGAVLAALSDGPDYDQAFSKGEPRPRGKGRSKEELVEYGSTWTGFSFEYDGDLFRYAVDLPKDYDPDLATPLLIDPGHGSGASKDQEGKADFLPYFRGRVESSALAGCLIARTEIVEQVGAGGLRGGWPEAEITPVFEAFFRDLASRFHVDPDRVYVTGLSQTGYWAWYLGRARADHLAGIAPMGAVTWQMNGHLENLTALPVYVLHGEEDATCPVAQPRATCRRMEELGLPVRYHEVAGEGHDFGTWGKLGTALDWLVEQGPRDPYPRAIAKHLGAETEGWCYWVRVDRLAKTGGGWAKEAPTAWLEGSYEGQVVRLESEGVRSIELCLSSAMLDLTAPVTVEWNGKTVHEGPVESDVGRALEVAVERADWKGTFAGFLELKAPR